MSIKIYPIFGLLLSIFFFSTVSAQEVPSVVIQDKTVNSGEIVEFDVLVTNYDDIIGATFSVEWDSMKLRYVDIKNIALGLTMDDSFGVTAASGGKVNYLYFDNSLTGNSLTDDAVLFTLKLEIIAEETSSTYINFGEALEVVDLTIQDLNATFVGAIVNIVGTVGTEDLFTQSLLDAVVSPNPFSKDAVVQLETSYAGNLSWTLSEINGQVITQGAKQLAAGKQSLILQNTHFKHTGSYILKLEMGGVILSKQLIRIEP